MRLRLEYRISVHLTNMELTRYSIINNSLLQKSTNTNVVFSVHVYRIQYSKLIKVNEY